MTEARYIQNNLQRKFPDLVRPHALRTDAGSVTAEYAIATMAAVGFAGLLVVILKGDEVRGILTNLVRKALSI